ncbi:hypothetical protein [Nocardia sp. R6R-6]|uniref:hypothetical protein n=1 Tax=Nocardia sp. R6R-6 TaxID=3459303 RepID=UPI00403DE8AB
MATPTAEPGVRQPARIDPAAARSWPPVPAGIAAAIDGPTAGTDLDRLRTAMAETATMGHTGRLCLAGHTSTPHWSDRRRTVEQRTGR